MKTTINILEKLSAVIDRCSGRGPVTQEYAVMVEADVHLVRRLVITAKTPTEAREHAKHYYRNHWSGVMDEVTSVAVRADVVAS